MTEEKLSAINTVIYCDVFDQDVMFHFGEVGLLRKRLEELFEESIADDILDYIKKNNTLGTTFTLPKGNLIYMPHIPDSEYDYGVLAHEIFHVVFKLTKEIGIEYSSEGEETYAYLIQFLTTSVLNELHKEKTT